MNESGFVEAQYDNLPNIDAFMMINDYVVLRKNSYELREELQSKDKTNDGNDS